MKLITFAMGKMIEAAIPNRTVCLSFFSPFLALFFVYSFGWNYEMKPSVYRFIYSIQNRVHFVATKIFNFISIFLLLLLDSDALSLVNLFTYFFRSFLFLLFSSFLRFHSAAVHFSVLSLRL